eukprot:12973293-Ditylum_brightwellii.AAC.1
MQTSRLRKQHSNSPIKEVIDNARNSKIKPRKAFNQDLLADIKCWRQEGNIVYLGIDANSNIDKVEHRKFVVEAKLYHL